MTLTRAELMAEIEEKSLDLRAFSEARAIIHRRVEELKESQSRLTPLPQWSGTDAVLGSLDLSIHAMERTVTELRLMLLRTPPAEESPQLVLLHGGQEDP